eukprot:10190807-Alexandrium_andersonii.AAC.1
MRSEGRERTPRRHDLSIARSFTTHMPSRPVLRHSPRASPYLHSHVCSIPARPCHFNLQTVHSCFDSRAIEGQSKARAPKAKT